MVTKRKVSRKKKAEVGINLQQPQMDDGAATLTTRRESTLGEADKQAKVNAAVEQLIENSPVSYEIGVLRAERDGQFFEGKLYQLGRLKQFLALTKEEWTRIQPNDVRRVLRQRGQSGSFARWYLSDWQTACLRFRQIIWNEDIKEPQGKAVIA